MAENPVQSGSLLPELVAFHRETSQAAGELATRHGARLHCRRGCSGCCVDDLSVFDIEAERIRTECAEVLAEGPHRRGACAFLDPSGACRIYAARPYVCRTQGLPLRWHEEHPAGTEVEYRDICPLNEEGEAVEELEADLCWSLGPAEGRLADLQARFDEGRMTRVRLRDLFAVEGGQTQNGATSED